MSTELSASPQQTTEQSIETPTEPESGSEPSEPRDRDETLPLDVVFDMLSVERRRQVLRYLRTESETTTLGDLAEHIAAIENDKPEAALSSKERKRVYVGLYQCHLPRMADAGVIDYDSDRGTVGLGPHADAVTSYLPGDEGAVAEQQWPAERLAIGLAGAGLFVGQALLFPHSVLAGVAIGLLVAACGLAGLTRVRSAGATQSD